MYPSVQDPLFGIFVKKTVLALSDSGAVFTQKVAIQGKRSSKLEKIFTYINYYLKAMLSVFHQKNDLLYVHFLTHNLPLIYWYKFFQNKPIVLNIHGSDINKVKKGSKLDALQGFALKMVNQIIVPSTYFKSVLKQRYPELCIPIFVYPSGGIDTTIFLNMSFMVIFLL
jgi:predicted RNA-binding protein Jag